MPSRPCLQRGCTELTTVGSYCTAHRQEKQYVRDVTEPFRVTRNKGRKKRRDATLRRDGSRCMQCGSTVQLELDHVVPLSRGGNNDPSNLRMLCHACHVLRHKDDP
jgi:5-methylcytosine-specific restriction endonuclease McrA